MPTVNLVLPGPTPSRQPHATIATVDGSLTYTVPVLSAIGIDSLASRWSEQQRPGRYPLTVWNGLAATTGTLTVRVGDDLSRSVEDDLTYLRGFAISPQPVIIACGLFYRWTPTATWAVTDCHVDDFQLLPGSNQVAQATVTLTLKSAMTPEQARAIDR